MGSILVHNRIPNTHLRRIHNGVLGIQMQEKIRKTKKRDFRARTTTMKKNQLPVTNQQIKITTFDKGVRHTFVIPTPQEIRLTSTEKDSDLKKAVYVVIPGLPQEIKGSYEEIIIEVTNDPTPKFAGGVVSLGYYVLRVCMQNVKASKDSLFSRFIDGFDYRLSRPARIPHDFINDEKKKQIISPVMFTPQKYKENVYMSFVLPAVHDTNWFVLQSFEKKDYYDLIELDPNSLFYPLKVVTGRRRTVETVYTAHIRVVEELIDEVRN